jgi:KaiC/GvpD/RAD55 family RecA-like ATPase
LPLLLLCGAPGAGKSSVGWEIYFTLVREGAPVAHVDLDGIGYGPPGHFGSFEMKFRNVAAVWRSYADAGASAFVVSGLRATQEDVLSCAAAVPGAVPTAVVLTLTAEEQRERIVNREKSRYAVERGGGSSAQTPEALEQFVDAARQDLEDHVDDVPGALVIDTVGVAVPEVARQILLATGWPSA